jgi:TonB family protein
MFSLLHRRIPKPQLRSLAVSLTLHGLFLVLVLHAPTARVISPSLTLAGKNGTAVTQLYWQPAARNAPAPKSQAAAEQTRHKQVIAAPWNRSRSQEKTNPPDASLAETAAASNANSQATANPVKPAGSQYGSLSSGALGHEVRPALPVASAEPAVSPADLVGGIEGSVVVEITIDDKGNIVEKTVIQSLRPAIDAKVLAALESWHFMPATRDGIAIPSKQDVYYHFKPN